MLTLGDTLFRTLSTSSTSIPMESPVENSLPPLSHNSKPQSLSALRKAHKERVVPELREEDLEESFVRGLFSLPFRLPSRVRDLLGL